MSLRSGAQRTQTAPVLGDRSGVLVRLERPSDVTGGPGTPRIDAGRLARAVEDLIRALDPSLVTARVEITVTPARAGSPGPAEPSRTTPTTRPDADLELSRTGRTLTVDGRPVTLTRREFDLLAHLQDHRGEALSRIDLMSAVWHSGYHEGDRTIDVHIRRLRVKLARHAHRLRTLRGYGYRLD